MCQANDPDAAVRAERVLSASARKVFRAFEKPDKLAQWQGPKDFTNTFEQFEFKPGGRSLSGTANEQVLDRLQTLVACESS